MAELSREEFVDRVIAAARAKFPLAKVERAPEAFSLSVDGLVASLENLYRIHNLSPEDFRRNVERWMVELMRVTEGSPDFGADFKTIGDRILPMILGESATIVQGGMVSQPFVGDLHIAYAIDHDRTIAYIPEGQFEKWKISLDDLHEAALANLVTRSQQISAHAGQDDAGHVNLIIFQTMDGYDASRILLPTLHERLREHLGSPFVAGIPNRDILLCFRNEAQMVERMLDQIVRDYRQMPHQISQKLLLVTADGIATRE